MRRPVLVGISVLAVGLAAFGWPAAAQTETLPDG